MTFRIVYMHGEVEDDNKRENKNIIVDLWQMERQQNGTHIT